MSNRTINVASGATYIEKQENNFYGESQQIWNDANIERDKEVAVAEGKMPEVLAKPEAMRLWDICRERGWVDDELKPKVSQTKAAILASVMADALDLCPRWAPFEQLWGISDMANKLSHAQMCNYYADTIRRFEEMLI